MAPARSRPSPRSERTRRGDPRRRHPRVRRPRLLRRPRRRDRRARTSTTKRMLYYYFGSKEGLYLAVLERAYADIRTRGAGGRRRAPRPRRARIRQLAELTFDHHESPPGLHPSRRDREHPPGRAPRRRRRTSRRLAAPRSTLLDEDPRARPRRRGASATTSTRSTCTWSSARSASSGSPTGTPGSALRPRPRSTRTAATHYRQLLGDVVLELPHRALTRSPPLAVALDSATTGINSLSGT